MLQRVAGSLAGMKYWIRFFINTAVVLGVGFFLGGAWLLAATHLAAFGAGWFALDRLTGASERLEEQREIERITRPGAGIG